MTAAQAKRRQERVADAVGRLVQSAIVFGADATNNRDVTWRLAALLKNAVEYAAALKRADR